MAPANPKAKRNLVRWSDDIDKTLLLTIPFACAEAGVKVPWDKVAEHMGPRFSGNAIVQHLAKLRIKMAENDLPVPPPIRRGTIRKEPSKIYAVTPKKRKASDVKTDDTTNTPTLATRIKKGKNHVKKDSLPSDEDEDEDDRMPEDMDDDSDDAYDYLKKPTKKVKSSTKHIVKSEVDAASKASTTPIKSERPILNAKASIEENDGPAKRTRGIKTDYTKMEGGNSDDETLAELEEEEVESTEPIPSSEDVKSSVYNEAPQLAVRPAPIQTDGVINIPCAFKQISEGIADNTFPVTFPNSNTNVPMSQPTLNNSNWLPVGYGYGANEFGNFNVGANTPYHANPMGAMLSQPSGAFDQYMGVTPVYREPVPTPTTAGSAMTTRKNSGTAVDPSPVTPAAADANIPNTMFNDFLADSLTRDWKETEGDGTIDWDEIFVENWRSL